MSRREKRVVKKSGIYSVIEMEFIGRDTKKIVDTCFEVRKGEKFLVEFEHEEEALVQMEFLLGLDGEREDHGRNN